MKEYLRHLIYSSISRKGKREAEGERREGSKKYNFVRWIAEDSCLSEDRVWALSALTLATRLYKGMEGATISLKLVDFSLAKALWLPRQLIDPIYSEDPDHLGPMNFPLNRENAFACIANFETGDMQISPEEFEQTIAIATENSIYVTGILLSDPLDRDSGGSIRHIIGNIGRPGISLLVAPVDPQIRPLSNEYNVVTHAPYDGKREDNFGGTSLQLRFTEWSMPIDFEGSRSIDQTAHVIETVISV